MGVRASMRCLGTVPIILSIFMLGIAFQPAWANSEITADDASYGLASWESDGNYYFEFASSSENHVVCNEADALVSVLNVTSGTVDYDQDSRTLVLDGVVADSVDIKTDATIKALGSLSVREGVRYSDACKVNLICESCVMNSPISCDDLILENSVVRANTGTGENLVSQADAYEVVKGSVNESIYCRGDLTMNDGTVVYGGITCDGDFTMNGGSIIHESKGLDTLTCYGAFTMNGGVIRASRSHYAIHIDHFYTGASDAVSKIRGGSIVISSPTTGIQLDGADLVIEGGAISITSPLNGIEAESCKLDIRGGAVKINKAMQCGIDCSDSSSSNKEHELSITGGKLTVKMRKTPSNEYVYAIRASNLSDEPKCIKKVKGRVSPGFVFNVKSNTYRVTSLGSEGGYVSLVKYGAKSRKAVFKRVKFGGYRYSVNGVDSKAFKTKWGKKLRSIAFNGVSGELRAGARAFAPVKSLKRLTLKSFNPITIYYGGSSASKKAYSKCRKSMTLVIKGPELGRHPRYIRSYFKHHGLPSSVKIIAREI